MTIPKHNDKMLDKTFETLFKGRSSFFSAIFRNIKIIYSPLTSH